MHTHMHTHTHTHTQTQNTSLSSLFLFTIYISVVSQPQHHSDTSERWHSSGRVSERWSVWWRGHHAGAPTGAEESSHKHEGVYRQINTPLSFFCLFCCIFLFLTLSFELLLKRTFALPSDFYDVFLVLSFLSYFLVLIFQFLLCLSNCGYFQCVSWFYFEGLSYPVLCPVWIYSYCYFCLKLLSCVLVLFVILLNKW